MADNGLGPILAEPALAMCADIVDDFENIRTANENRLRTLTADINNHGHGLSEHNPDVARLSALVDALKASEHQAVLNLRRTMRAHPLGGWVAAHAGIGEKQAARLLGTIRDPYWNDLHDRRRSLRELYAYCGYHVTDGAAPVRRRGQQGNWSTPAQTRVWLLAQQCVITTKSPFRRVYDEAREYYAGATHTGDCVRCGSSGRPALAGSELSAGHQHARAQRKTAKAILRSLWEAARQAHVDAGDEGIVL